jgi:DNA repair exonuclease SbcCD nuclease subunit
MKIIHTADWQIGKPFRAQGEAASRLTDARYDAIEAIGKAARDHGVRNVLVAGDVFDGESLQQKTIAMAIARMERFGDVVWWLLPGNHDPARPGGLWETLVQRGLPANICPLTTSDPVDAGEGLWILPAPLTVKKETRDVTETWDEAETPGARFRVGLAHGSITTFSDRQEATNIIPIDRLKTAGLSYLALGDWHGTNEIAPGVWYSGTPEPDRYNSQDVGQALLVELKEKAAPVVSPIKTGTYHWHEWQRSLISADDVDALLREAKALPDPPRVLLRLKLDGGLSRDALVSLDNALEALDAMVAHLDVQRTDVRPELTEDDLDAIDVGGVLRDVVEELYGQSRNDALAPEGHRHASEAITILLKHAAGAAS